MNHAGNLGFTVSRTPNGAFPLMPGSYGSTDGAGSFMEVGTSSVLMLPYTASSVGVARRRLIGELTEAGVVEVTACDAGLVLSELISNALRHATPLPGSVVRVSWTLADDCVEIAVSDGGGPTVPMVNKPAASALGGRGLGIVDQLAQRWGVTPAKDAGETTVWAVLPLSADADQELDDMTAIGPQGRGGASRNGNGRNGAGRNGIVRNGAVHNGTGPGLVIVSSRDA